MGFRSLQSRIVVLFLALLLIAQGAGFLVIRGSIADHARRSVTEQLQVGERVFARLLEQNAGKLTQGARILAADYGFRQAIASDDRETVASALENHGARIDATLAAFYTADGMVKASIGAGGKPVREAIDHRRISTLVGRAERDGFAAAAALVDGHLVQLVVVPVKAPVVIGWVVMGFPVDHALAADMRALSRLDVSFLAEGAEAEWRLLATSFGPGTAGELAAQGNFLSAGRAGELTLGGAAYGSLIVPFPASDSRRVVAVLQRSISEALAPFARLQVTFLVLTIVALVFSFAGSVFTARRIARPLTELAEGAKRMGEGNYEQAIAVKSEDEVGELARALNQMREGIAEREGKIRRLAYWDKLTGLPNRDLFVMRLGEAITKAQAEGLTCSVLMMDLDRFKYVNDVLGHAFGDALLKEVAARLEGVLVRRTDVVARLGGDEFAVLLPGESVVQARAIVERLRSALEAPMQVQRQAIDMSAGIGLASYPEHADTAELLLARAEIAMYAAKRRRAGALVYDTALDEKSRDNLSLLSELRQAVDKDELVVYYQPKLALADGRICGVETLVRWIHPQHGFVPPDRFIPFAEQTGFITDITQWVVRAAVGQAARWNRDGPALSIAVNLSTRDLMDQDLPQRFAEMFAASGIDPGQFCLEITESAIMDDPLRALATLDRLHAMGFKLSIDDFGTGYSSLAYLKRLPVDELKIDRSFVCGVETDPDDAVIVRSTIDLGHNMGLQVVAEGIEDEAIWNHLLRAGCDVGQGYFMSKPLPADRLVEWLKVWTPPRASTSRPLYVVR